MTSKEQILNQAILLFAEQGYAGVSMRDLARSSGLGVSTLYHHFPDKQSLYLQTVQQAFSNKATAFTEVWQAGISAQQRLEQFVVRLTEMMLADRNFHRLMQRELLEADDSRMQLLAEQVFEVQFKEIMAVISELVPDRNAHLLAVSVLGLVCNHLEMEPMRKFLPGYQIEHEDAQVISNHIVELLLNGLAPK